MSGLCANAATPDVTGLIIMRNFRLLLGQCTVKHVKLTLFARDHKRVKLLKSYRLGTFLVMMSL